MTSPARTSELQERLDFIGLDDTAAAALRSLQPLVAREIKQALAKFYDKVRATPQTAVHFGSEAQISGAADLQARHWQLILSGTFTDSYMQAVQRIGQVHASRGIEPRWYIGGYAAVVNALLTVILMDRWPRLTIDSSKRMLETADAITAFVKAAFLDMDISISVYLDALSQERLRAEAERLELQREQEVAIAAMRAAISRLSAGDLTTGIEEELSSDFALIRTQYNEAIENLRNAVGSVVRSAGNIGNASREISVAADDLSQRTEEQASCLEQTSAALEEISSTVRRTADRTAEVTGLVTDAKGHAESSSLIVQEAVGAMSRIEESSTQIAKIIGLIDEIAFQTNLLALNAGVEAARAGDSGRGFAVIASEVRALAQRSSGAAKEIRDLILNSSRIVAEGVDLVSKTGTALDDIVRRVGDINHAVVEIAAGAREQSTGIGEVSSAVNQMDQMTQQNAAMVEQTTAATHQMTEEAARLLEAVSRFAIEEPPVAWAPQARRRA